MSPASRDPAVQLSLGPSVACSSGPLNILFLQPGGFPLGWLLSLGTWSPGLPGWDRNAPLAPWPQVQGPVWPCLHLCLVSQDQTPGWETCKKYIEESREGGWEAWPQGTREEEAAGHARTVGQARVSHQGACLRSPPPIQACSAGEVESCGALLMAAPRPLVSSCECRNPCLQPLRAPSTAPCRASQTPVGGPSRGSGQSWVGTPAPLLVSCVASSSHHPLSEP